MPPAYTNPDGPSSTTGIPFGEYRLLKRLGTGGMAEVFLAIRDGPRGFAKHLVIKRILPHLSANKTFVDMFLREARLAALVDHPNLVHVSAFGEIRGEYYIAMEYVEGFTLADLMQRVGTVTPGVACRMAVDVLDALNAVHNATDDDGRRLGLVHRDVSPRNIMVTRDGAVKLLDFGIAISETDETSVAMGTRRFIAPEMFHGKPIDHRADLFAVGVSLYGMISGELPYEDEPKGTPQRAPLIPERLWPTLSDALSLDPEKRPASARAFQSNLELYLTSRGIEGTRTHLAELLQAVLPPSVPRRNAVLTRLTRQITRLTRSVISHPETMEDPVAPDTAPITQNSKWGTYFLGGLVILGVVIALITTQLWPASPPMGPPTSTAMKIAAQTATAASSSVTERTKPEEPKSVESETPSQAPRPVEPEAPSQAPRPVEPEAPSQAQKTAASPRSRRTPARSGAGRLTIDTRPWTVVYLKEKKLGMTPLVNVKLPSGPHRLTLKNPNLQLERTISVRIRPGKVTRIQRDL